jgi:hypothetical protein
MQPIRDKDVKAVIHSTAGPELGIMITATTDIYRAQRPSAALQLAIKYGLAGRSFHQRTLRNFHPDSWPSSEHCQQLWFR